MKTTKTVLIALSCLFLSTACAQDNTRTKAEKQGWHLSMQSYTFHLFTVMESLDKTKELGLHYIEIYPGQKMGEGFGDAVFGYNLTNEQQNRLKGLAKEKGVKIISSGVWTPARDEWDMVFAFAKSMGMEFISAEPAREDWDVVEGLAKKYNIKVAVHNHPNEASYWKPEILLKYIGQRSKLLGSSADVGHFKRMGIEPVPALQELRGRLIALHFKDIAPQGEEGSLEDVVWGQGVLNVKGMLEELKRQNFKGYFTIEYEANWENNLPQIKQSIDYFNQVANEIL
ncbi:MAG: sugar phosphate isomerase/epimerase [Petrimonas sp.]|nr:sugar phosphate isomerase/epimerase [Petrimonas sp.]